MKIEETAVIFIVIQIGKSVFIWGPPGQGKSSLVRRGFEKLGYRVHVIRMNTILPHHLGGTPLPDPTGEAVKFVPPQWVHQLNEAEKSVLLLDDLTGAPQTLQIAGLGLLDERQIGGVTLKAHTMAAGNPNTLATARFPLDAAAANRCIHVFITSDGASFAAAAEKDFPAPVVPRLIGDWKQRVPIHRARILDFLKGPGNSLVNSMPDEMNPKTVAWPSERSWEACWQAMAAYDVIDPESVPGLNLPEVKRLLFYGCVGEGAYKTFVQHVITPMEADAKTALAQGRNFVFPKGGDKVFGLLSAVTARLQQNLAETSWNSAWELLEALKRDGQLDRGITFAQDLISLGAAKFRPPEFYKKHVVHLLHG